MPSDLRPISYYKRSSGTIALSLRNRVFQQMILIWPFKDTKGQTDLSRSPKVELITPSDSRPISYYKCSSVTIELSLTETLFFSKWPWSDLSRTPKVKLITPFNPQPMSSYKRSIVTIALSRTETVFLQWSWSDLSRTPKVKLITPFNPQPMSSYKRSIVTIALSHTETVFQQWSWLTFQGHQRSNWLCHLICDLWVPINVL